MTPAITTRAVAVVAAVVAVTDAADANYGDMSGGEQRRVCLGSTLVNDPDVHIDGPIPHADGAAYHGTTYTL